MGVPDSVDAKVIEARSLPAVGDPQEATISALEQPVGTPPLKKLIPPGGEVAIVVSDKTRFCSYPTVLPLLLDYLNVHGLPDSRMFLLVAYGAHRHHTEEENCLFYGEETLRRVRLIQHNCRDASQLTNLPRTSRGTQVRLNKRYLEAAMSTVVGSISFHYFAGFGGGRKMIFPGLASEEGILSNHRIFVEATEGSLSRMRRFKGSLQDHPLNDDLMEAVAMAPPSFVLNFCLNREGDVAGVFAGDWKKSHSRGCQFLLKTCVQAKRKYDLVIASCGGHPEDINFIQAHKTIDNAFDLLTPGGTLLILACCEDGIGSDSFLQWFDHEDATTMREALLRSYSMNGGTALALKMKADASRIHLYSSLDSGVVKRMGLRPVRDIQQSLQEIIAEGNVKSAAILPEGATTVVERESGTADGS